MNPANNTGPVQIQSIVQDSSVGGGPGKFVLDLDSCIGKVLVPSDSCTIKVTYAPASTTTNETDLRQLDVSDTALSPPQTQKIHLHGKVTAPRRH